MAGVAGKICGTLPEFFEVADAKQQEEFDQSHPRADIRHRKALIM